jgi:hypothetical protein
LRRRPRVGGDAVVSKDEAGSARKAWILLGLGRVKNEDRCAIF